LTVSFTEEILAMIGVAVAVALFVSGLVYAGGSRRSRRYRPGRPFPFTPVWFLANPPRQPGGDAQVAIGPGSTEAHASHGETGGASDRW
jgi:hypothetical protein